jgi:NADH-quinone oxidoreductase subunit J
MTTVFCITALTTLASAVAAMSLRNLVHCVLCLTVSFIGMAMVYLQLSSQFVGFAQVMVYVGAVAILMIFALLMTRGGQELVMREWRPMHWLVGGLVSLALLAVLVGSILQSPVIQNTGPVDKVERVKDLGQSLVYEYLLPLEALALLLTVALIGAALIALPPKQHPIKPQSREDS